MILISLFLTIPFGTMTSLVALLPPIRRTIRRSKLSRIVLPLLWGGLIFSLTLVSIGIIDAQALLAYHASQYSSFPPATIERFKRNETDIAIELALRTALGTRHIYSDSTACYSNDAICDLADLIDERATTAWSYPGAHTGMVIIGLVTAVFAVVSLVFLQVVILRLAKADRG